MKKVIDNFTNKESPTKVEDKETNDKYKMKKVIDNFTDKGTDDSIIDAKIIATLDHKYYLQSLVKSMANYIIEERYPMEMLAIENYAEEEKKKHVTLLQERYAKEIVEKHYPTGRDIQRNFKKFTKETKDKVSPFYDNYYFTKKVFEIENNNEVIEKKSALYYHATKNLEALQRQREAYVLVYKQLSTDKFSQHSYDEIHSKIYERFKDKPTELFERIKSIVERIKMYKKSVEELS